MVGSCVLVQFPPLQVNNNTSFMEHILLRRAVCSTFTWRATFRVKARPRQKAAHEQNYNLRERTMKNNEMFKSKYKYHSHKSSQNLGRTAQFKLRHTDELIATW